MDNKQTPRTEDQTRTHRCDVILLFHDSRPALIPLDEDFFKDSLQFWEFLVNTRLDFKASSASYNVILEQVMQMLWDRVVSLVVSKLKESNVPEGAHVWWCPTSLLSEFPFHAAGPFESDGSKKYFLDDYVSSYTPTLTALIDARRRIKRQKPNVLLIGDTKSLPSVEKEIQTVERYGMLSLSLINDQAAARRRKHNIPSLNENCLWPRRSSKEDGHS